jgi:hypothetical protein
MGLSYEYLKTHMSQGLFTKVSEEYNLYPVKSRGGPLLLFLMIQLLIASNDSMCADGKWIRANQNKATFPTFTSPKAASAFLGKVNCHNCGGQHFLRDCQQPLDQARI